MSFLRECISLQRVNLSCFSPGDSNEEFISCDYMIRGCTNLTTIYVSEDFSRDGGAYWWDTRMFTGCTALVGSVGFPRNDFCSSYAIYDTEEKRVTVRRIHFDFKSYIDEILQRKLDLPSWLYQLLLFAKGK